jgi:hypothetical protein
MRRWAEPPARRGGARLHISESLNMSKSPAVVYSSRFE